ncbi:MAG: rod shape-determining protein MreC [Deltaproteobacteria bacterium]|jgi:rod shape-determining protein MreC|nr:rod shape-determining protein MreC [Deltaproteobacteria bacterium]MBT7202788.1 rod shape-determining protein MreC [Deltaproteobacteria bacterium]
MRWLRRNLWGLLLGIVLLSSAILLYQSYQSADRPEPSLISEAAHLIASPFQKANIWFSKYFEELESYFEELEDLKKENQSLKKRILHLNNDMNALNEKVARNNSQSLQLNWANSYPEPVIFGDILGISTDPLTQVWWLNLGAQDGIEVKQPAAVAEGLVGRVQNISAKQLTIQIIMDQRSRFPVLVQRTRSRGIVVGTGSGIELRQVLIRDELKIGDRIITSGLSQLFPKGLFVGQIKEIVQSENQLFQTAVLEPGVDFSRLESVGILPLELGLFDPDQPQE